MSLEERIDICGKITKCGENLPNFFVPPKSLKKIVEEFFKCIPLYVIVYTSVHAQVYIIKIFKIQ